MRTRVSPMSVAIVVGTPWVRSASITTEGIILSKQAVASFSIIARLLSVRAAMLSYVSFFDSTMSLAVHPGREPTWPSLKTSWCLPCQSNRRAINILIRRFRSALIKFITQRRCSFGLPVSFSNIVVTISCQRWWRDIPISAQMAVIWGSTSKQTLHSKMVSSAQVVLVSSFAADASNINSIISLHSLADFYAYHMHTFQSCSLWMVYTTSKCSKLQPCILGIVSSR